MFHFSGDHGDPEDGDAWGGMNCNGKCGKQEYWSCVELSELCSVAEDIEENMMTLVSLPCVLALCAGLGGWPRHRVSPWAGERGWRLLPIIVKANDDLRQEQLASQLLHTMRRILRAEGVRVWLRPYDITPITADSGIIEAVEDTISLDALFKYRKEERVSRAAADNEDLRGTKGVGESGSSRFR